MKYNFLELGISIILLETTFNFSSLTTSVWWSHSVLWGWSNASATCRI